MTDEEKDIRYNKMHRQVTSARDFDTELAAEMSKKFAELRRVNREWDDLVGRLEREEHEADRNTEL